LAAVEPGEVVSVGDWQVTLESVDPVAGPNWTAMEGRVLAQRGAADPILLAPQSRNFWAPQMQTSESALATQWDGQLYAVIGNRTEDGRWQLRIWWKPFVTFIWYGGLLIALGGVLAIIGRVLADLKRRSVQARASRRRRERRELGFL